MSGYNASQVVEIFKPKLPGWRIDTGYSIKTDVMKLAATSPEGKRTSVDLLPSDLMLAVEDLIKKFLPVLKGDQPTTVEPEPIGFTRSNEPGIDEPTNENRK